jgi:hypothetical protein
MTMNYNPHFSTLFPIFPPFHLAQAISLAIALAAGSASAGEDYDYHVRRGETLIGISRDMLEDPRHWPRLQSLNHVADPHRLMPGSVLRIPISLLQREPVSARVTAVSGDVRADGAPLKAGSKVQTGAQVVTGDQSFATIELIDGSRLVLQPGCRMTVEELSRFRNTNLPETRLRLNAGRVESIVTKTSAPRPRYTIITPAATMGVRGTQFRVGADETSGAAQAEVTDGVVGVQGDAKSTTAAVAAG